MSDRIPAEIVHKEYFANPVKGVGLRLFYSKTYPDVLHIIWISRSREAPKGSGEKALRLLMKLSDKHGVTLALGVDPHSKKFLLDYYARLGFNRIGKSLDMERRPKMRKETGSEALKVGDPIKVKRKDGSGYLFGKILKLGGQGATIKWDDRQYQNMIVPLSKLIPVATDPLHGLKRGDKVAAKWEGEWYEATFVARRQKSGRIDVKFEDGTTATLEPSDVTLDLKEHKLKQAGEETDDEDLDGKPSTKDLKIDPKSIKLYNAAKNGGDAEKVAYMKYMWHHWNEKFFSNKMKEPRVFTFLKNQKIEKMRRRGDWTQAYRQLRVNRQAFHNKKALDEILLHEQCHQSTYEIDGLVGREPNQGHGPLWKKWMVHCGLNPSRYDTHENADYMDEEQRQEHEEKKARIQDTQQKHSDKKIYPSSRTPALWFDPRQNKFNYGLIVCPSDLQGKRWAFIDSPYGYGRYMKIPSDWFYRMPDDKRDQYLTADWMKAAEIVERGLQGSRDRRSINRQRNKTLRNIFGGY